jgi:hypothetical protein
MKYSKVISDWKIARESSARDRFNTLYDCVDATLPQEVSHLDFVATAHLCVRRFGGVANEAANAENLSIDVHHCQANWLGVASRRAATCTNNV